MQALEILKEKLIGSFISRFSVGDVWDLNFGGYHIIAQQVVLEDEGVLNQLINGKFRWFEDTVDKEYISKCAIVAATMRRLVNRVEINEAQDLTIGFEGDVQITITTDTDIVDWQWCLNRTGVDPYTEYMIACFDRGEILINEQIS